MKQASTNSTYDVADAVRKRIIRQWKDRIYLRCAWLHDKQAGGKRKNYT